MDKQCSQGPCCKEFRYLVEVWTMSDNKNYIRWIRSKVGHDKIILVFAGGCIFNEKGEVLLQRRGDTNK